MLDNGRADRLKATGELLQALLLQRDAYAGRWQQYQRRGLASEMLSQSAVAQVIAGYLWDSGERSDAETQLPRGLKDRVHRALHGEALSGETLNWFIDAFQMTDQDARRLRDSLTAGRSGLDTPVVDTLSCPEPLPIPQRHRTVAAFERHTVGADRRAVAHRTTRAVMACEEGVDSYPYRFLPGASDLVVLHGGYIRARHEPAGSSPILEIAFSTRLRRGQIASLEYQVQFSPDADIACEYRRVAHARADNIDIVVQFHPQRLPDRLWWAIWDDHKDGNVLRGEEVTLDLDNCIHRFIPYLENAAAGFFWKWLPASSPERARHEARWARQGIALVDTLLAASASELGAAAPPV
jgi:hypothetical protein